MLFLDLDRLKVINDSLGHELGDAVLRVVADRLLAGVRSTDMVSRFGGDEFVLVCGGLADEAEAVATATRLGAKLREPIVVGDRSFHVSASIGVAVASARYHDPDDLIRDADAAMYEAKTAERGSIRVFDPSTHSQALRRLDFESAVRSGAAEDQWVLHYQPLCDVATGRIVGAEALVRWQHPEEGLLYPTDFLGFIEDAGLVRELGGFVLRSACLFAAGAAFDGLTMSVNVAAGQLLSSDFPHVVLAALRASGLPAARLCLEITESAVIKDLPAARETLLNLRDIGVRIAVDDFGTGFSALSYLGELPLDELKVDRSFVTQSHTPMGRKLFEGIVSLSSSLGLVSVAEGVETAEQLALVTAAGCHVFQGYLVGRPVPGVDFGELVAQRPYPLAVLDAAAN